MTLPPPLPNILDAALLAAKEEGFWIGRSTGGSRAEIDAAIRAMKE